MPDFPAQVSPTGIELADRLAAWAALAKDALAPATLKAYRDDARVFAAWCDHTRVPSMPATADAVAAFLRDELAAGRAVATLRRRVATIARMHRAAGAANPCDTEVVRLTLKGAARQRGTDAKQAAPLTASDLAVIRSHAGDALKDRRDVALVAVARDLLARRGELVALQVEHIEWQDDGAALVRLRRFKTDTASELQYLGPDTTTVLKAWLAAAGITTGPIWRAVNKAGRLGPTTISDRDVARVLKALATRARLPHAATISGHSARVGMAVDLAAAGMELPEIMQAGAWKSPQMVSRYTRAQSARRGAVARFYGKR